MAATDARAAVQRLLAAALALGAAAPAQAESAPEQGQVSLKWLDYLDSQPGRDRVRVRAPSLGLQLPLGSRWSVAGSVISDAISGASPAYHSSGLSTFRDERHAGDVSVTRYFDDSTVTLGTAYSTESDYVSRTLSLQAAFSSDDRNTTVTVGGAFSHDRIDSTNQVAQGQHKRQAELLVGVTRVLTPLDVVQLNLSFARVRGYLSDPYKVFDERPRQRDVRRLMVRWNHHVTATGGSLRSHYRYSHDSFGIRAHTLGAEFVQPLPRGFTLTPALRLHSQSAARFYVDVDPDAAPFVTQPPEGAVFSSLDHRLSAFGALTWGLKVGYTFGTDWTADVKFERYVQRAGWRLGGAGSPGLAEFRARSWQLGLSRRF